MSAQPAEEAEFTIPEGSLIDVKLTVRLPAAATEQQITEWLNYGISQQGGMSVDSPLYSHTPEAWGVFGLDWTDTGESGREEHFDHQQTSPTSSTYRVRYLRTRRDP
jgi:hypothetical protein